MEKASPKNNYHYNPLLQPLANTNRQKMTKAAAALWKYVLRAKNMRGYTFRRERPILNYIADFACLPLLLVIEVDGVMHDWEEQKLRDRQKDEALSLVGFTVLRFSNGEVLHHIDIVAQVIADWIDERSEEGL